MSTLILFDIDATLLVSGGAGIAAMDATGKALFGDRFTVEGLDVAGRLDPLIIGEMFDRAGVSRTAENLSSFRSHYAQRLQQLLAVQGRARALPGVHELLARLRELQRPMGLLTGNFRETGCMKLHAAGIDPDWFTPQVWGDESPHDPPMREHLPGIAIERHGRANARSVDGSALIVVGDTPHDVRCAKAHGGRCLAVATGRFSQAELAAAGADWVFKDLSDVPAAMSTLLEGHSA